MSLDIDKRTVREHIIALRDALPRRHREVAGVAIRRLFHAHIEPRAGATVSAFWPSKGEIDILPLFRDLHDRGHRCVLPVVLARRTPLAFRRWTPETELVPGNFGIPVPPETAEIEEPDLLLVPLLGFDRAGHRLGWGGGFYDRTLAKLRATREITAVGIAFSAQEVDRVPHGPNDQPLDWVITEREAIRIGDAG